MYAVSRRYRFDPQSGREINREVREYFLPMIRTRPGFVAYFWLHSGDGVGESISVFETREAAEASVEFAARWVQLHELTELLGPPEILHGEVVAHFHAE